MKKIITLSLLSLFTIIVFTNCSKTRQLKNRLVGTWNIDNFTCSGTGHTNIGTITFNDDGSGTKTGHSYSCQDWTDYPFTWTNTDTKVTLTETKSSSSSVRIFTIVTNEKTKQTWTTTEGTDNLIVTFSK